jgi:hypothetical protein
MIHDDSISGEKCGGLPSKNDRHLMNHSMDCCRSHDCSDKSYTRLTRDALLCPVMSWNSDGYKVHCLWSSYSTRDAETASGFPGAASRSRLDPQMRQLRNRNDLAGLSRRHVGSPWHR